MYRTGSGEAINISYLGILLKLATAYPSYEIRVGIVAVRYLTATDTFRIKSRIANSMFSIEVKSSNAHYNTNYPTGTIYKWGGHYNREQLRGFESISTELRSRVDVVKTGELIIGYNVCYQKGRYTYQLLYNLVHGLFTTIQLSYNQSKYLGPIYKLAKSFGKQKIDIVTGNGIMSIDYTDNIFTVRIPPFTHHVTNNKSEYVDVKCSSKSTSIFYKWTGDDDLTANIDKIINQFLVNDKGDFEFGFMCENRKYSYHYDTNTRKSVIKERDSI